jgi:ubiquinone/menaquinone biosynthesis C-methylase UbiE
VSGALAGGPNPGFRRDRLQRLSEMERWHFWFAGRRELVRCLVHRHLDPGRRLLDVGCGTGWQLESMLREGHRAVGLDLRPEGLAAMRDASREVDLVQGRATQLPLRSASFDAVLLLDVLEHVEDRAALREVHRVLREGGVALLSVPAFSWMWSYRDQDAGHLRRYHRRQLAQLLVDGGFRVLQVCYYQCLLFPVVLLSRLLGRRGPGWRNLEERPLPVLNAALSWLNRWEGRLGARVPLPFGSTLVAACRKQD